MSKDPISSKETLVLPDALIGRKVGGYEIRGILGKGGMGVVYRTHDAALDREVALKLLPPSLSADKEYAERFIREARMAAKLDHPRIVPVYAAGSSDQGAWIAMQLVRGRTLAEELHDGMRPTFTNVLKIARQTAEALGAAHKAGLIHRDIKPGNLIVDAEGNIKVLDFGLARPAKSGGYTQDGTYLGTPEYSSPEQCQTADIDGRADLYSLGCVMYEMLGGRIPHVAETPLVLFTKIVNEEPIALRDLNPKVPPSLAAIVSRLLAKSRDARYRDADALIRDLDKVVVKDAPGHSGETVIVGPADRARVAAWTLAGVLATLLVAAVVHTSPWSGMATGGGNTATTGGGSNVVATTGGSEIVTPTPRPPVASNSRIVLLDFKNLTNDEQVRWLETALPELIASSLGTHQGMDPLERDEVTAAMKKAFNARLTSGGSDDVSSVQLKGVQLLEALDAGVLVRGSFYVNQDRTVRVMARVLIRKGDSLEVLPPMQVDDSLGNMLAIADHIAGDIATALAPKDQGGKALGASTDRKILEEEHSQNDKLAFTGDTGAASGGRAEPRLKRRRSQLEALRGGESVKKDEKSKESGRVGLVAPAASAAPGNDAPKRNPADGQDQECGAPKSPPEPKRDDANPSPEKAAVGKNDEPGLKDHAVGDRPEPGDSKIPDPAAATPKPSEKHDDDFEKQEKVQMDDLKKSQDLLSAIQKYVDEIRESEKDLPEQELGDEGTHK